MQHDATRLRRRADWGSVSIGSKRRAYPGWLSATRQRCSISPTSGASLTRWPPICASCARCCTQSGDLTRLLRSPVLSREAQGKAIAALTEAAGLTQLTRDFLGVVARNRRLFAVPEMIEAYLRQLAERRGEVTAQVTVATPLDDNTARGVDRAVTPRRRRPGGGRYPRRSGTARWHDRQGRLAHGRCVVEQPAAASADGDAGERLSFWLHFSSCAEHVRTHPMDAPGHARSSAMTGKMKG